MKLRPLLPDFRPLGESGVWTERSIRPLLHKDFGPADQKRLGKKIATKVKGGMLGGLSSTGRRVSGVVIVKATKQKAKLTM